MSFGDAGHEAEKAALKAGGNRGGAFTREKILKRLERAKGEGVGIYQIAFATKVSDNATYRALARLVAAGEVWTGEGPRGRVWGRVRK